VRVAIYAGTFDPVTTGHLSVIRRGARLFDELWVLVAVNPNKRPLFSGEERVQMIRDETACWPNVQCASTSGFVVAFARNHGAAYLIRGVRGCTDIDEEITLAHLNHSLAPEIETLFVPAHPELSRVSSSSLKEKVRRGADIAGICPPHVARCLERRLGRQPCNGGQPTAR
jgi:pantetheine-phosphate adenylyltransferase